MKPKIEKKFVIRNEAENKFWGPDGWGPIEKATIYTEDEWRKKMLNAGFFWMEI